MLLPDLLRYSPNSMLQNKYGDQLGNDNSMLQNKYCDQLENDGSNYGYKISTGQDDFAHMYICS
jgi:hypothetical protein